LNIFREDDATIVWRFFPSHVLLEFI
jgi:hypothetical protein